MIKRPVRYKALGGSILASILILLGTEAIAHHFTMAIAFNRLVFPLLRLIGFITLGLLAGQSIEFLGWTRQLAVVARPFFAFSKIGQHGSAAFTTAFVSGAAANAMLLEFYENKTITKVQLFLTNYMNHFPAFFLHLPTTMFIVLPLTGRAGAFYFLLTFLATLLRVFLCLCFGKLFLPPVSESHPGEQGLSGAPPIKDRQTFSALFRKIKTSLPGRVINILVWVIPIYTLVFALTLTGFFKAMNLALSQHIALHFIPVESLSVVVLSFAAEFTSGFAAAGALLNAGVLTVKQTVIALLLGNILAFPIRALRHQLPRYMGIFSPALGLQLLLSGQLFRITSLVFVGLVYYGMA
jgi:hypothetical protein